VTISSSDGSQQHRIWVILKEIQSCISENVTCTLCYLLLCIDIDISVGAKDDYHFRAPDKVHIFIAVLSISISGHTWDLVKK